MSNLKALIWVVVLWLGAQIAEYSLSQWLAQHSEGILSAIKPALLYIISNAAGEFGAGFLAGVIMLSSLNWPLTCSIFKKIKAFFSVAARETAEHDIHPTTINHFGGAGGNAPGSGGGGGSAQGPYSSAGAGGEGGAVTHFTLPAEVLEKMRGGGLAAEVVIGKGGKSDPAAIKKGEDGGDSWITFTDDKNEEVFKIKAAGGKGGESGAISPDSVTGIFKHDFDAGFRLSTLMFAEMACQKYGFLYLMGGGINHYTVETFPANIQLVLLSVFSIPVLNDCLPRRVNFSLVSPSGEVTEVASILVASDEHGSPKSHADIRVLDFVSQSSGVWVLQVTSGEFELSRLPLLIRTVEQD